MLCLLAAVVLPTGCSAYLAVRVHSLKAEVAVQAARGEELEQELAAMGEAYSNGEAGESGPQSDGAEEQSAAQQADTEPLTEADSIRTWERESEGTEVSGPVSDGILKVYLTFDDGPSIYTDEILDILAEYGVKATFFVVGEGKKSYEEAYRRILEEGHTLGMHSYSHVYQEIYSSKEAFIRDVNELQDYLHEVTGVYPDFYRFPGGSSNQVSTVDMRELKDYLEEIGIVWYDWNISSGDATAHLSKAQIVRNCTSNLEGYGEAVILLHDAADKKTTVQALPEIIETLLQMEDTVIVPITKDTIPIQHMEKDNNTTRTNGG